MAWRGHTPQFGLLRHSGWQSTSRRISHCVCQQEHPKTILWHDYDSLPIPCLADLPTTTGRRGPSASVHPFRLLLCIPARAYNSIFSVTGVPHAIAVMLTKKVECVGRDTASFSSDGAFLNPKKKGLNVGFISCSTSTKPPQSMSHESKCVSLLMMKNRPKLSAVESPSATCMPSEGFVCLKRRYIAMMGNPQSPIPLLYGPVGIPQSTKSRQKRQAELPVPSRQHAAAHTQVPRRLTTWHGILRTAAAVLCRTC